MPEFTSEMIEAIRSGISACVRERYALDHISRQLRFLEKCLYEKARYLSAHGFDVGEWTRLPGRRLTRLSTNVRP